MFLSGAAGARLERRRGFSLLEVVIAAGLVLLTITAVSAAVASVSHAGRRSEAAARVDLVLASVSARLAALPYCAGTLPHAAAVVGAEGSDLLAATFPSADVRQATSQARYVAADEDALAAGSFITRFARDGVAVTCVARFRDRPGGAWLPPEALDGWDVAASESPPAPVLVVEVTAAADGVARTAQVIREAGAGLAVLPAASSTVAP
jgi:type II secretory pathway pseudopilin PulG